ncbi:MAG: hypothetical protein KDK99_20045, partial [Verrucomicrobiales bacterium]|nr:hypothetical protein [Verrucomicrobiales bacterium]
SKTCGLIAATYRGAVRPVAWSLQSRASPLLLGELDSKLHAVRLAMHKGSTRESQATLAVRAERRSTLEVPNALLVECRLSNTDF